MIRIISARAPSNIALIKYMGKKDGNLPENPSLSLTLDRLCSVAEIRIGGSDPRWIPEAPAQAPESALSPRLSNEGEARILRHCERVRAACPDIFTQFKLKLAEPAARGFELRAANTFPASSGIASSASSFAAVTLAMAAACAEDPAAIERALDGNASFRHALAALSRQGSGSSCRSFEGPWVAWEGENARAVATATPPLAHFVLLISSSEKAVGSSEAHSRVKGSALWPERPSRAEGRYHELRAALASGDLAQVAHLAWAEAWDMHSLFHTASEPFTYWETGTLSALKVFAVQLKREHPPIITLDAGPNIHLLCAESEREQWRGFLRARFPSVPFLEDAQGLGARLLGALPC